ncbi:hypothetical protein IGI04_002302 [Brassica rapa subsp. trilocularis]|uniref:Uncharacterized protein n=1 Tax=Brassica rapa subsp. trilocularis TaxID=1813537 RepID=A0ABQ7NVL3_BRACM|nr:hypothetical protein IGI04_035449 [Brassica rapa subsp. trilocularis]KAG5413774.1 hypothetical protein IGI04_001341 [Brassica rapa subsp. trilocularis]KAG5414735.1 hypothetical protein IGI04_002302 [Brassica rapa subsp. trilocularis]
MDGGRTRFWMEKGSGKKHWLLLARKLEHWPRLMGTKSLNSMEVVVQDGKKKKKGRRLRKKMKNNEKWVLG